MGAKPKPQKTALKKAKTTLEKSTERVVQSQDTEIVRKRRRTTMKNLLPHQRETELASLILEVIEESGCSTAMARTVLRKCQDALRKQGLKTTRKSVRRSTVRKSTTARKSVPRLARKSTKSIADSLQPRRTKSVVRKSTLGTRKSLSTVRRSLRKETLAAKKEIRKESLKARKSLKKITITAQKALKPPDGQPEG